MTKIRGTRASRNGAFRQLDLFTDWLQEHDRRAREANSLAGRWLQRRVLGLAGPVADLYALANGLGGGNDR